MDHQRPPDLHSVPGRYLRQAEVLALLRISRSTLWRLTRRFPELRPTRLTQRVPLWDALVIGRFLDERRPSDETVHANERA